MEDKIIKGLAYGGKVSVICARTTKLLEEARKIHNLSPIVAGAFGRMLTITSIMGTEMKSKEHKITVQIKGNGPIGMMMATTNNQAEIKGYVTNPIVDLPLNDFNKLDISGAVGDKGYINVIKNIGMKEPYIGISILETGEIGDDFAKYFVESEQRRIAIGVGELIDKDGIKASGGYLISLMPDATQENMCEIEKAVFNAGAMSKMLKKELTLEEISQKITRDKNIQYLEEHIKPKYKCDCSKKNMEKGLKSIGKEELKKLIDEDGHAELICHFCNKKYNFTRQELQSMI